MVDKLEQADSPQPPPNQRQKPWHALALLLALWAMSSAGAYLLLVRPRGELFDFYPRWYGARAMLHGINPYSAETTRGIQQSGLALKDWSLSSVFLYPATITYLLLPFWLLPFEISVSLWNGLQLLLVMAAPVLVFLQLGWRPKPLTLAGVTLFSSLIYRHSINVFVLGQFTVFVLAALIIACWGVQSRRDWLAAFALAAASIRPEGMLLVGAFALDLLLRRNFKVIGRFCAVMGVALALSFAQIGFWLPDFAAAVLEHADLGFSSLPLGLLGSDTVMLASIVILLFWALWMVRQMGRLGDQNRLPRGISVAILFVLIALPQTNSYTLVYALLPLWLIMREDEGQGWLSIGAYLLMFSPWLFLLGKERWGLPSTLEQLLLPIMVGGLFTGAWLTAGRTRLVQSVDRPHDEPRQHSRSH